MIFFILHVTDTIIRKKVNAVISRTRYIWNVDAHVNWTDLAQET